MLTLAVFFMLLQPGIEMEQQPVLGRGLDTPRHLPEIADDLGTALGRLAKQYRLPMVVVLAGSPRKVKIPAGMMISRQALNQLVAQNPNYAWEARGPGVYFCHRQLRDNPKNMLNWRLKQFTISDTLADLELRLRANLSKIWQGITTEGGVIHGILAAGLAKEELPKIVLYNMSAVELLFKIMEIEPSFSSVMVYPTAESVTDADIESVFASWNWVPFPERE